LRFILFHQPFYLFIFFKQSAQSFFDERAIYRLRTKPYNLGLV